jgi:hypothetical protein
VTYRWWNGPGFWFWGNLVVWGVGVRPGAMAMYVMSLSALYRARHIEARAGWSLPDQWPDREPKFRAGPVWFDWTD